MKLFKCVFVTICGSLKRYSFRKPNKPNWWQWQQNWCSGQTLPSQ